MALMFAICNPQPNWIPRKPKLMFQICQKVRGGLSISSFQRFFSNANVYQTFLSIVERDQRSKSITQLGVQRSRTITPLPVSTDFSGKIHARFAAQAEHILQRNNRHIGY